MYLAKNNFYAKKRRFVLTVAFFTCQATEDKLPRTKLPSGAPSSKNLADKSKMAKKVVCTSGLTLESSLAAVLR